MIASTHLAVGAASALLIQEYIPVKWDIKTRYILGLGAGILSHIAFDSLGHAEYSVQGIALFSLLWVEVGVTLLAVLGFSNRVMMPLLMWGMFWGAVPDLLYFAHEFTGIKVFELGHAILHLTHGWLITLYVNHATQIGITVCAIVYIRIRASTTAF